MKKSVHLFGRKFLLITITRKTVRNKYLKFGTCELSPINQPVRLKKKQ